MIKCKLVLLDNFIEKNKISNVDFIKCDVEGAELFVFQGGLTTIERFKPIVISEISRINQKNIHIIQMLLLNSLKK